ncbi:helix-turn-helix transcriptional regulator [Providencia rettgeri]
MENRKAGMSKFQFILTKIIGTELYNIRKFKGISGEILAKKLKVSQQQVSRYERGESSINCVNLFLILFYLETSPQKFLKSISLKIKELYPEFIIYIHEIDDICTDKTDNDYLKHFDSEVIVNYTIKNK